MEPESQIKEIPNDASLFRWIQKDCLYSSDPDFILPKAFSADKSDFGMSTDWQCESCPTAHQSLLFVKEEKRMNYGIAQITDVGKLRMIKGLSVIHKPEPDRLSHTNVYGLSNKDADTTLYLRMKIRELAKLIIRPVILTQN